MEFHHDHHHPPSPLASAWGAVCGLSATRSWLWLARPSAIETASAVGLVLLESLPRALVTIGAEISGHG
jgi:hypothetical protein